MHAMPAVPGFTTLWGKAAIDGMHRLLRAHPCNPSEHRITRVEHEHREMNGANTPVFSILRDWVKGQVAAVECGILSFERAFPGQILPPNGETMLQHIERGDLLPKPPSPAAVAGPRG